MLILVETAIDLHCIRSAYPQDLSVGVIVIGKQVSLTRSGLALSPVALPGRHLRGLSVAAITRNECINPFSPAIVGVEVSCRLSPAHPQELYEGITATIESLRRCALVSAQSIADCSAPRVLRVSRENVQKPRYWKTHDSKVAATAAAWRV